MPFKPIIVVFALVGLASVLKPEWTLFFVWIGGMALLWIITGRWVPPSRHPRPAREDAPAVREAEQVKPLESSMEAEDLEDLARLDAVPDAGDDEDAARRGRRS